MSVDTDSHLDRQGVALFGQLLTELGCRDLPADLGLEELLRRATAAARSLKERVGMAEHTVGLIQERLARETLSRLAQPVEPEPPSHQQKHHVMFRGLDPGGGVVLSSEWIADNGRMRIEEARADMLREMAIDGESLTLQELVRC